MLLRSSATKLLSRLCKDYLVIQRPSKVSQVLVVHKVLRIKMHPVAKFLDAFSTDDGFNIPRAMDKDTALAYPVSVRVDLLPLIIKLTFQRSHASIPTDSSFSFVMSGIAAQVIWIFPNFWIACLHFAPCSTDG